MRSRNANDANQTADGLCSIQIFISRPTIEMEEESNGRIAEAARSILEECAVKKQEGGTLAGLGKKQHQKFPITASSGHK